MSPTFINSSNAPTPIAPYSHAVKANGFIYLSGFCGLNSKGELVGDGDVKVEVTKIFENLTDVIKASEAKFKNIVKLNIFVTDLAVYKELNEVCAEYFKEFKPARSCVEVKGLPVPNAKVEIECVVLA